MMKYLPEAKKKELDLAFKTAKNKKEANRIQVVRLLSKGRTHKDVAEVTGYSHVEIQKLVSDYNRRGLPGLKLKPRPKNNAKLTTAQKDRIKRMLRDFSHPSGAGISVPPEDDFWSVETLRLTVKRKFGLTYGSRNSYVRLFKYCGYTFQKVEFVDEQEAGKRAAV